MAQAIVLSFRRDVSLIDTSGECVVLEFPGGKTTLRQLGAGSICALQALASSGGTADELVDFVRESDGFLAAAAMYYHLQAFERLGLLRYTLVSEGYPIAALIPMSSHFKFMSKRLSEDARFRLSRFTYCRRDNDVLMLESPLSATRMLVHHHMGATIVAELAQPRTYPDLCGRINDLAEGLAEAFLRLLVNAKLVGEVGEDGALLEDVSPVLAQWAFHDLLFHSRSRSGRHDYPAGGTYPFLDRIPSLAAVKPRMSEQIVSLHKPDIGQLIRDDPSFAQVMEDRKSVRRYGERSMSAEQLGEFLYRVGRVRRVIDPDPSRLLYYQISDRPYPSGGATYDLELYVIANSCAGVIPGVYHYDPLDHQLCRIAERNACMNALVRDAQLAAGLLSDPEILIILASRFQRVSWKYSGIAYSTTLKNVGVLFQSMYLAATAMGLAPCGLGAGNSSLFAEAVGTDYFVESSVGEFLLGTPDPG